MHSMNRIHGPIQTEKQVAVVVKAFIYPMYSQVHMPDTSLFFMLLNLFIEDDNCQYTSWYCSL